MINIIEQHYQKTLDLFRQYEQKALEFGNSALIDIDINGKTIRQMSIDLCGNAGLEDVISRRIMAARWDLQIKKDNGQLYEDVRTWLSPTHFSILWQISERYDYEFAHDCMEQCLIRTSTEIVEARPKEWLLGKLSKDTDRSTAQIWHKVWTWATKALPEAWGVLERKGNDATAKDRRRVRILKMVIREFSAEQD